MAVKNMDLHGRLLQEAEKLIDRHKETDEGTLCFNLHTYLEDLEDHLIGVLEPHTNKFQTSPCDIARYLWCCLALASGSSPDGYEFRDMPILD